MSSKKTLFLLAVIFCVRLDFNGHLQMKHDAYDNKITIR